MRGISKEEFSEQITQLYESKLVDTFYAGSYNELMEYEQLKEPENIPNIYEMYEEVIATWAGYNEEDYDDDEDYGNEDFEKLFFPDLDLSSPPSHVEEVTLIPVRTEPKIGRNDPCLAD